MLALFAKFLFAGVVVSYVVVAIRRVFTRRGRGALGPAAVGSVYEMLNEDRRKAVEIIIDSRVKDLGLHTYYYEIHPRDLEHVQFPWTFQRQLYDCMHDYLMEMFTRTPQMR